MIMIFRRFPEEWRSLVGGGGRCLLRPAALLATAGAIEQPERYL